MNLNTGVIPSGLACLFDSNYSVNNFQVTDLYELAKRKSWNASTYVDWTWTKEKCGYPMLPISNPLVGFPQFDSLSDSDKSEVSWLQHQVELSEILHGEQGAMLIACQLVQCLPTANEKLFASSQVMDEARHVEFFSRYIKEHIGEIYPPSKALSDVLELILSTDEWDLKLIVMQIVLESIAMGQFQRLQATTLVPILKNGLSMILKDEARHTNFGVTVLKDHLTDCSSKDIQEKSNFVLKIVDGLINHMNYTSVIADRMGWDKTQLLFHCRKKRIAQHKLGDINNLRQLVINLSSIGLLTKDGLDILSSRGFPVEAE